MKHTNVCPKCNASNIVRFDGYTGAYGAGNNVLTKSTIFSGVNVNRYVCCSCGYSEEWIDKQDLPDIVSSKKAQPNNPYLAGK